MSGAHSSRFLMKSLIPLYELGLALREMRLGTRFEPIKQLKLPVVSVGGISAGGAGKTPLTIALARALTARGIHVDVLTRGYGRQGDAPVRVDSTGSAAKFGDEPLVIAMESSAPVFVAKQRYEAGVLAERFVSASQALALHLLDDGFQHRQLHRDVDIVLIDRRDWVDDLLPAGRLREPLTALHRAHVIAVPADDEELAEKVLAMGWEGQLWRVRRQMKIPVIDGPVVAFCGIAHSDQFFEGLTKGGLNLASRIPFPDHHIYKEHDLDCIEAAALSTGAVAFVTTEKDRMRLGSLVEYFPDTHPLRTAELRTEIEDEDAVIDGLKNMIWGVLGTT
jgi:tetraacyldisaccharide 4'-kinase